MIKSFKCSLPDISGYLHRQMMNEIQSTQSVGSNWLLSFSSNWTRHHRAACNHCIVLIYMFFVLRETIWCHKVQPDALFCWRPTSCRATQLPLKPFKVKLSLTDTKATFNYKLLTNNLQGKNKKESITNYKLKITVKINTKQQQQKNSETYSLLKFVLNILTFRKTLLSFFLKMSATGYFVLPSVLDTRIKRDSILIKL